MLHTYRRTIQESLKEAELNLDFVKQSIAVFESELKTLRLEIHTIKQSNFFSPELKESETNKCKVQMKELLFLRKSYLEEAASLKQQANHLRYTMAEEALRFASVQPQGAKP